VVFIGRRNKKNNRSIVGDFTEKARDFLSERIVFVQIAFLLYR
jgi:hypothetical protein